MKNINQKTSSLIMFLFLFISSQIFGQTQLDINQDEHNRFLKSDIELNLVYNMILKEYKSDTVFIKNFKKAQKIWLQFRDAEIKSRFPDRENGYYGSIHPMCLSYYLNELTIERTKKLKIFLTGLDEGESCSGSIKVK